CARSTPSLRDALPIFLSSGAIAWSQLKAFTKATVFVAGVDAVGIGLSAFALGVPFASGIGLLVFLGSFVPIVGALVSGFIAVARSEEHTSELQSRFDL